MLFNSFSFFVFFILVTTFYFAIPHRFRWMLLLTASCVFYMFFIPVYILILVFTIVVDYFAGILIERAAEPARRRWLVVSLIANLGVLAFFKYYNFLNDNLTDFFGFLGSRNPVPYLDIILPIGLSFHTFQAMSYTIEVYRGHQRAERHPGIYALYVMFYPQLVAGPIERPQNLLHQFREKHSFDYQRLATGLQQMAWGLFKKVCVADRLGVMVDAVYGDASSCYGASVILATVFFSFQLYCDFSGYSDMAIGAARIMGFTLMKNFNTPFFATSLRELWGRWHISLSTWFRDYVYISLGGNRVSPARRIFNLVFTFTLSGLWHGANWGFAIWGFHQGSILAIASVTKSGRDRVNTLFGRFTETFAWRLWQMLFVFLLFCSGMVFFRAADLDLAVTIYAHAFVFNHGGDLLAALNVNPYEWWTALALLVVLVVAEWNMGTRTIIEYLQARPAMFRKAFLFLLMLIILNLGVFNGTDFIYFQF